VVNGPKIVIGSGGRIERVSHARDEVGAN